MMPPNTHKAPPLSRERRVAPGCHRPPFFWSLQDNAGRRLDGQCSDSGFSCGRGQKALHQTLIAAHHR